MSESTFENVFAQTCESGHESKSIVDVGGPWIPGHVNGAGVNGVKQVTGVNGVKQANGVNGVKRLSDVAPRRLALLLARQGDTSEGRISVLQDTHQLHIRRGNENGGVERMDEGGWFMIRQPRRYKKPPTEDEKGPVQDDEKVPAATCV
ncbi:hypothetical protein E4U54_008004 [Claviceps lovelessii]|nr:hypothetical protein E4U54_008004 [Claviceps lovelessii]